MKIKMISLLGIMGLSVISLPLFSAEMRAADKLVNQSITYFCSKANVNTQQSISIGRSTKVTTATGPFYQMEYSSKYQATLDLIANELDLLGVDPECAEYLMTRTRLQGYEQGNVMARVYFDFDQFNLTQESKYILDIVVNVIKQTPSELVLEGHTDNIGSKGYNFQLGLKRSEAAQQYLLSRGVKDDNLLIISKGEGEPITDNRTSDGRERNRRVDVIDEKPIQ